MEEIKDLGVFYDSLRLYDKNVSEKVKRAYMMLGIIKRNFVRIAQSCFVILYKSLMYGIQKVKQILKNWN